MRHVWAVLFLPLFAVGCGPDITLVDDIDVEFDLLATRSHKLHTPYVVGTEVTIRVDDDDDWLLRSADDSIFTTRAVTPGQTTFRAARPGKTAIRASRKSGRDAFNAASVEIATPDRATLTPHGPLIIGRREPPIGDEVRVLVGGEATFVVRYFDGQRELHGNGVLTATSDTNIVVEPRTSFLFERREWLTVSPQVPGRHAVRLFAADRWVGTLHVIGVGDDEIEAFSLAPESERGAKNGNVLNVLAEAFDIHGNTILGIDPEWELDGLEQFGHGDLFRYTFDRRARSVVSAHLGPHESRTTIRSEEGFVYSSNEIGCAGGTWGGSLLMCLVFLCVRARRRLAS